MDAFYEPYIKKETIRQASATPASLRGYPLSSRRRVDRTKSSTSNSLDDKKNENNQFSFQTVDKAPSCEGAFLVS